MLHKRFIILAAALAAAILLLVVLLRIDLPVEFHRPCRLVAQAEWTVLKTGPETFETRWIARGASPRRQIEVFRFERGDWVRFRLAPEIESGQVVSSGSVVAYLHSQRTGGEVAALRLELAEAEATLRAVQTGEKAELVAAARGEADAARAVLAQREAEYGRARELLGTGVWSEADFELAQNVYHQAQAEVAAADSRLRAAQQGEKEPIVAAGQARADRLRQAQRDAEARLAAERLAPPFPGELILSESDSALVRVVDSDTLYALAPVSPSRAARLAPGDVVRTQPLGNGGREHSGRVVAIDRQASTVAGRTFFWVTVAVPNAHEELRPGITGQLRFRGARVDLLTWLVDRIRHASDRTLGV